MTLSIHQAADPTTGRAAPKFDLAVVVDSCEPWRLGHVEAIERALQHATRVVLLVSAAGAARSVRHPFTTAERLELSRAECARWGQRVAVQPLPDRLYQPQLWRGALRQAVAPHAKAGGRIVQLCPSRRPVPFLSDWAAMPAVELDGPEFWALRECLFGTDGPGWQRVLDATTPGGAAFLGSLRGTPAWDALRGEYEDIQSTRAKWRRAPYAPVLATVDALVLHEGHLLLVQRARNPGAGLWALPGGFVDPGETLLQACLRELHEETGLTPGDAAAAVAAVQPMVFDAPTRSLRARIVTHVFRFDLASGPRPSIAGGDDAGDAQWIALPRFLDMEEQCFEDHFHIVGRMLGH